MESGEIQENEVQSGWNPKMRFYSHLYNSEDIHVPPRTLILMSTDIAIQVTPSTYGRRAPQ